LRALPGEVSRQLRFNPVLATDAGAYTVEVFDGSGTRVLASRELVVVTPGAPAGAAPAPSALSAAPAAAPGAESTAGASIASSSSVMQSVGGSAGVAAVSASPGAAERQWWVYKVESTDAQNPLGPVRRGYWVMEYIPTLDPLTGKVTGISSGRSAWIWHHPGQTDVWAAADLQAAAPVPGGANWVVAGVRSGAVAATLQLTGSLVAGADSAWHGAPDSLAGTLEATGSARVVLRWDSDAAASARWIPETGWAQLLNELGQRLQTPGGTAVSGD
jgi:hypothetical protein